MNVFFDQLIARVEAVPGVEQAGLVDALPLGRNRTWETLREPGAVHDDDYLQAAFPHLVDERHFSAMRVARRLEDRVRAHRRESGDLHREPGRLGAHQPDEQRGAGWRAAVVAEPVSK
jgi:hypothetical protein